MEEFKNAQEINTLEKGKIVKEIVLFGASHIIDETLALSASLIVDNNRDLLGNVLFGMQIESPDILKNMSKKFDVIVCTTSIREVKKQLEFYGYTWGENARSAPVLREQEMISELEDREFSFLISSGLPSTAESFSGGGIHLVSESNETLTIDTIYEGNTHGLIRTVDGGYAFTCQGTGVVCLDANFNVSKKIEIPMGLRPHGLRQYKNDWVVVCSLDDSILVIDGNSNEKARYRFGENIELFGVSQHHCNDVEVIGDLAFVSMFSVTGNWKRGVFDGGVIQVNLLTGNMKLVTNELTMPHSITQSSEGMYVLDSFKGRLLGPNFEKLAQLPGFVRGLDRSDTYYFVGESKNRNFSRLNTERTPVSIDSRITIIDREFGFCRSVSLPSRISEIHSVIQLQ